MNKTLHTSLFCCFKNKEINPNGEVTHKKKKFTTLLQLQRGSPLQNEFCTGSRNAQNKKTSHVKRAFKKTYVIQFHINFEMAVHFWHTQFNSVQFCSKWHLHTQDSKLKKKNTTECLRKDQQDLTYKTLSGITACLSHTVASWMLGLKQCEYVSSMAGLQVH